MTYYRTLFLFGFFSVLIAQEQHSVQVVHPINAASLQNCTPANPDCYVHIFRVQLSQAPDGGTKEVKDVKVKPNKKYGQNVFVPIGNKESEKFVKEIVDKMPDDAPKMVRDRIHDQDFLFHQVEPEDEVEEIIAETKKPPTIKKERKERKGNAQTKEASNFPLFLTLLLVAIGVVVGILCTCLVLFSLDYKRKPKFDRTTAVSYRRPSSTSRSEKIMYNARKNTVDRSMEMQRLFHTPSRTPSSSLREVPPHRLPRITREHHEIRIQIGGDSIDPRRKISF